MFKVGDTVRAISASHGWGNVHEGAVGSVVEVIGETVLVDFPGQSDWTAHVRDLVLMSSYKPPKRKAAVLEPKTKQELSAVELVRKVVKGEGKFTGLKIELEGAMGRTNRCGDECTLFHGSEPHEGCKYFRDTRVANDFILQHLAQYGLAEKCKVVGQFDRSYVWKPIKPLAYSRVYTDSETEWTLTIDLEEHPEDVLYAPYMVDAFNALIEANGKGVDVAHSGMHTAFIQGKDAFYPSTPTKAQQVMFANFKRSMSPLLPALYLLGANRVQDGKTITRSLSPRRPVVSNQDKYSAIAYRQGALEFRVFDTCYEHRDQMLDNVVVMAQAVSKYWHKQYVPSKVAMDRPVYFGDEHCEKAINSIEELYKLKEHIIVLNKGLRCIKPPYLTVKEVKMRRNFKLTVRSIKEQLDLEKARPQFEKELQGHERRLIVRSAELFYREVRDVSAYTPNKLTKSSLRTFKAKANKKANEEYPKPEIEKYAYQKKFGYAYSLGVC